MKLRLVLIMAVLAGPLNAQSLPEVLDRASRRAERFAEDLSAVKCTETMTQARFDDRGKQRARRTVLYDYLIFIKAGEGQVQVEESRLRQDKSDRESAESFLLTGGFATLALVFHPGIRDGYSFSDLAEDTLLGRKLRRIHFELKPGAPSMAVLRLQSRNYPIAWEGAAWIDAVTGDVYRIHANLKSELTDVGLRSLETEVDYAPVRFAEVARPLWLPRSASIGAETLRQHWKNVHEFADYRLFSVTTSTREASR
jgi:hypothetical protein